METSTKVEQTTENDKRYLGRVKWFNNKLGYGFITYIVDGNEMDVFCHHTQISPQNVGFRTLYTGEYVEFSLGKCDDKDDFQAENITGPAMGPLMSDCRNESHRTPGKGFANRKPLSEDEGWGDNNHGGQRNWDNRRDDRGRSRMRDDMDTRESGWKEVRSKNRQNNSDSD